jgi:hypothetical protein
MKVGLQVFVRCQRSARAKIHFASAQRPFAALSANIVIRFAADS